jgi:D-alanyl-D-alanine dipeptidase
MTDLKEDGYAWYKITFGEDTGYIRSDFLVFEEPEPLPDILYGKKIEDLISGKTLYSKLDYVSHAAPRVIVDFALARDDNFIGKKMYSKDVALIQYGTGKKLAAAAKALAEQGYQLVLWDAYRPYSVSVAMYEYVNNPTLFADPKKGSKHNRGAAVDVTLYKNGNPLNMPTNERVMDVDEASRGSYMTTEQHTLLDILTKAMEEAGFDTYYGEWWHFNDSDWESYPVMDYPLSMF